MQRREADPDIRRQLRRQLRTVYGVPPSRPTCSATSSAVTDLVRAGSTTSPVATPRAPLVADDHLERLADDARARRSPAAPLAAAGVRIRPSSSVRKRGVADAEHPVAGCHRMLDGDRCLAPGRGGTVVGALVQRAARRAVRSGPPRSRTRSCPPLKRESSDTAA